LRGVVLENRKALDVMKSCDSPETVYYLDPTYLAETRSGHGEYSFEMKTQDHIDLAIFVSDLKGFVAVSGYRSDLYNELYKGWHCEEKPTKSGGTIIENRDRIECLWMNRAPVRELTLFD